MPHFTRLIIALLSAALLAGCSFSALMDRPTDEVLSKFDSRFMRGRVDTALTAKNQALWIDSFTDEQLALIGLSSYTREQLKNDFQFVSIRYHTSFNKAVNYLLLARKDLNLGFHDIVDGYTGKLDEQRLRNKETFSAPSFFKMGTLEGVQMRTGTYEHTAYHIPAVILGVVCRADDDGCSTDSSPETTIGLGRKMTGPEDYRGAEGESKQEIGVVEFP